MADDRVRVNQDSLRRIDIPVPNPALADWLTGPQCKAIVTEVTTDIYLAYRNTLPVITGNLQEGADMDVEIGGFGEDHDRWMGRVYNRALSYRRTRGKPYPRYIEYGKPSRGVPGQYQLRRAAHLVAGGLGDAAGINIPGLSAVPAGRGSRLRGDRGRFVRNPLNRDR